MPVRTILVLNQRYCQVELFDHHKKKHISVLKYENSRTIRRENIRKEQFREWKIYTSADVRES
ncbi:unnamed protein product [Acanthoscelides obtectus]|uniref:Uncharacterized protein n=1 Tax=Acanthoscelides obtectus TaxID=200917 RepID=A0A9P0KJ66_ACAOB|nr:unnamed protein product [Acanthoscelides obtectus]CAK1671640.1 hypothetical protein AOBTE_LOCUS28379 [Acanthoscelides obtectus]